MLSLSEVAVGALATWRLSHLCLYEEGPFSLLRLLRERLGVEYDMTGRVVSYRYELTVCPYCLSVWMGFAVATVLKVYRASFWLLLPFALSAVSSLIGNRYD